MGKLVYSFGDGQAEGGADQKRLLGGKGANLAEMTRLGLPVPPGFTLATPSCLEYLSNDRQVPEVLKDQVNVAILALEEAMGRRFGDVTDPLLVSVRSGAAVSMPGMMDTVLNLGLNDITVEGLAAKSGNPRFAFDSYRRFIQMYANVVLGLSSGVLDDYLEQLRDDQGVYNDSELTVDSLKGLVETYKRVIEEQTGEPFPQSPAAQLWSAIGAVFDSWNNRRAIDYREAHGIPDDIGTAVNVQAMVFGNMGESSATGVAFTRDPKTGERKFFGEWLRNAQGEDVVAGIRTPQPINADSGPGEGSTLEEAMPAPYAKLVHVYGQLESHYRDMQDLEFTIEQGRLWMLQTRTGKRSPRAEVRIAVDMANEGLISKPEAILRVKTETVERLLHPQLDPNAPRELMTRGLGASPGAATGKIVLHPDEAVEAAARGESVILVRRETSPEDIHGMLKAQGVLTCRGGMTSHAAVVARGLSKTCVVGASSVHIDEQGRTVRFGDHVLAAGAVITLDGGDGSIIKGAVETIQPETRPELLELMTWVDDVRRLDIYTNADTARECRVARGFGASGVGLCRTEHMFFDAGRIVAVREMILAQTEAERRAALAKLKPMQRDDFEAIFRAMDGLPVIIRLLDPPLHEFLPTTDEEMKELAEKLGLTTGAVRARTEALEEVNPMLGHRGCRLGLTYPEIYEMQTEAIMEAAIAVSAEGEYDAQPRIMLPLIGHHRELAELRRTVIGRIEQTVTSLGRSLTIPIGTMIELPRACLTASEIAAQADFFSFGTNDLTQTTFGISRDDGGSFIPHYLERGLLDEDPFVSMDPAVAALVDIATKGGRATKPGLSVGICGEHGGEPRSVAICHGLGLDYVSCSPFRVPIARLAAGHAALNQGAQSS